MIKLIAYLITAPLVAGMIALISIYEAFCLRKLWDWFVVDTFSLLTLTYPVAIGLSLIATMLTSQIIYEPKEVKDKWHTVTGSFLRPAICLLIGWITKTFFMS